MFRLLGIVTRVGRENGGAIHETGSTERDKSGGVEIPSKRDTYMPGYIYSFNEHFQAISLKLRSVPLLQYLFSLCDYSFNILGRKCLPHLRISVLQS